MSFIQEKPLETVIRAMSIRISKRTSELISGAYRQEDRELIEEECYMLVRVNLEELVEELARRELAGSNRA